MLQYCGTHTWKIHAKPTLPVCIHFIVSKKRHIYFGLAIKVSVLQSNSVKTTDDQTLMGNVLFQKENFSMV